MGKFLTVILVIALGSMLFAQNPRISGSVRDTKGVPIAHASVELRNQATGVRSRTRSDHGGRFHVNGLRSGTYQLTVQAKGFKTLSQDKTKIETTEQIKLQLTLERSTFESPSTPSALRQP